MEEFLKIVIVGIFVFLAFDALLHTLKVLRARWWLKKGLEYQMAINFEKALEAFNKAIELDPNYAEAYACRAFLLNGAFLQFDKALEEYNKAIALDPNYATAYYNRGHLYKKLGNNQKAISDLREACLLGHRGACEALKRLTR